MNIPLSTVGLLVLSNLFMTFAWYGHLKFKQTALWIVILASWGIAFFEYCLQVPANRMGHGFFTAPQLKVIQEGITFFVFAVFSWLYLKEKMTVYDYMAFLFVFVGVAISALQPRV